MFLISTLRGYVKWFQSWRGLPVHSWVSAIVAYKKGDYSEAARRFSYGLSKHGDHPAASSARLDLAHCLFKLGGLKEAQHHLKSLLEIDPHCREAYIRLAHIQSWMGMPGQSVGTLRRAIRYLGIDSELASELALVLFDNEGPSIAASEVSLLMNRVINLSDNERVDHKYRLALSRLKIARGEVCTGNLEIARLAMQAPTSVDALLCHAGVLAKEGKIAHARKLLRQALTLVPNHPKVLSFLAETYLLAGSFYNPQYAVQLALSACQNAGWESPQYMHVLADSYYNTGDRTGALLIASKAKLVGSKYAAPYRGSPLLDRLIEELSTNTNF